MKLSLLLIIFSIFNCFSQKSTVEVQVEYQLFYNTNLPITLFATLSANSNIAIYQEKYSTSQDWEEHTIKAPEGVKRFGGTDIYDPYLKIDSKIKEILFFDKVSSTNFLVKDSYQDFIWNITSETKDVAGYSCIKATTTYRGRAWIAWFTPQIPISFGPWKLFGLPGLIIEAYDEDNKYTFKPVKIKFGKEDILKKDFTELMETQNKKPRTYQKFLKDTDELRENLYKRVNDNPDITITRIPFPREGMELKFEWEE